MNITSSFSSINTPCGDFMETPCSNCFKPNKFNSNYCSHCGKKQTPMFLTPNEDFPFNHPLFFPTIPIENFPNILPLENPIVKFLEPVMLYNYTIYLSDPSRLVPSCTEWDYAFTLSAENPIEAVKKLPDYFKKWRVVRIFDPCTNINS